MKNFKRNKKRYRSTVISLFVSIVLFISASAFGLYLRQSAEMTVQDYGYDISFAASQSSWHLEDAQLLRLYDQMKNASGITGSTYWNHFTASAPVQQTAFTQRFLDNYLGEAVKESGEFVVYNFSVQIIEDSLFDNYLSKLGLSRDSYGVEQGKLPAVGKVQGYSSEAQRTVSIDIFRVQDIALAIKPLLAHQEELSNQAQNITLTIANTVPEGFRQEQFSSLTVFAPYSDIEKFGAPPEAFNGIAMTFSSSDPMKSAAEMETMIKDADAANGYTLFNTAEAMAHNRNILLIINIFTYGFVLLISLITIANVFNTISTGISLRKREFAMLRSAGMGSHSFNRMMNFECIFYGLKALLYGLPVSFAITYLIYKAVGKGVDVVFTLPWSSIAVSIVSVFFVVFVTMIYATGQIRKANVIDALRTDIV